MTRRSGRIRSALGQLLGKTDREKGERAALRAARAQQRALQEQRRRARDVERAARIAHYREQSAALSAAGQGPSIVTLDYDKAEIRLIATSEMERDWRARSCAKEPWTVAWLERSLAQGGVLYDIGANIGAFSLIAANITGATVVAFEPGYASFAHLCDNIVLNRCQGRIIPVPLTLGRETLVASLIYRTLQPGQSRHEFIEQMWSPTSAAASTRYQQPVLTMPLDEVIRQFRLPLPNHIKLDVDGGELNVLHGAWSTLASPGLQSILVEVDESLTDNVTALLAEAGFSITERSKRLHRESTQVWYGVFCRRA